MALTGPRSTKEKLVPELQKYSLPIEGGVKIYQGAIVALDAYGNAVQGQAEAALNGGELTGVGRALATYDNSTGAAGAFEMEYETGVFAYDNDTDTGALAQADVGTVCYIKDDHTVSKTATSSGEAGIVEAVNSDGVWVRFLGVSSRKLIGD